MEEARQQFCEARVKVKRFKSRRCSTSAVDLREDRFVCVIHRREYDQRRLTWRPFWWGW